MISDLELRTLEFSKKTIRLCNSLDRNTVSLALINQVIRSATSIGANYREANETDTKKDFRNRIRIAKKEAKETISWLTLIREISPSFNNEINVLLDESSQLMKILAAIYNKTV